MKSGAEYSRAQFNSLLKLYDSYNKRLRNYSIFANYEHVDEYDIFIKLQEMKNEFLQECTKICPDRFVLCDIVLDICYKRSATKRFAWEMCGEEIVYNLLKKNNFNLSYPYLADNGEIDFGGNRFNINTITLGGDI